MSDKVARSLASLIQKFNPDDFDLGISKQFQFNTMHFIFSVSTVSQINLTRGVLAQTVCILQYMECFISFACFSVLLLLFERPNRGIHSCNTKGVLTLNVHLPFPRLNYPSVNIQGELQSLTCHHHLLHHYSVLNASKHRNIYFYLNSDAFIVYLHDMIFS